MRPILMKGHERPWTFLKSNRDGDLLFSCAKDHTPTVWFADNGERLGTYRGHNGAVWCCDRLGPQGRINRAVWGPLNKTIISAGEDAVVHIWDSETGKLLKESDKETGHKKTITSLTKSADSSHLLTGSLDKSAKLRDIRSLTLIKTYVTEHPVNAVAMSPLLDHVVLGGGQDASAVATTDHCSGKFEAKFFDKAQAYGILIWTRVTGCLIRIYLGSRTLASNFGLWLIASYETGESVLTIKGPRGRINRAVWGPLNKTIVSAGEDAIIRIWNSETGKLLKESDKETGHKKTITSLTKSADSSHLLTGSLDKSAKLWDIRSLTLIKTYVTERPVNAVAMSPLLDHVVLGRGQDASAVTTTDHCAGKFEARFFGKVLQEEIGGVKRHFGPINALAFNPDGKRYWFFTLQLLHLIFFN
ncbi:hypothetical protein ACSBR1_022753 [Camellia fascicularis]